MPEDESRNESLGGARSDDLSDPLPDDPAKMRIVFLILADAAQVAEGKMYILGGGWDRLQSQTFPYTRPIGVAFGIRVPWNEANRQHTFAVNGTDADSTQQLFKAEGSFETGRPPGIPQGHPALTQLAFQIPLTIPSPGSYVLEANVDDGKASATTPFFAVKIP